MVLDFIDQLEGGFRCRLLLQFLIVLTHNNIVDIVHVGSIHIFLPMFLMDGLINVIIFEVGNFYVSIGTLNVSVLYDGRNLWVGYGLQCLSHNGWLTAITVRCANIPLQFLHRTGKLVRGYWYNIEEVAFYFNASALEVGIIFALQTLGLGPWILAYIHLRLGRLSLAFIS